MGGTTLATTLVQDLADCDPPPLVIIEGFMGGSGAEERWGNFQHHWHHGGSVGQTHQRRVIFVSVGPVSSLHDRACEIFYALMGGTIDYGQDHADAHQHGRFGRTCSNGLYPQWSKERPLHFLGHSFGGPTIVKIQWLLSTSFFGNAYTPDMLLSVNTVSAPFRGTPMVYLLGERVDAAPAVHFWSVGSALTKVVLVAAYLAPWISRWADFHTEARGLSCREISFWSLLGQLWRSDWAEGRDVAPYDCTFVASDTREEQREGVVNPNTFYRSYTASWASAKTRFRPPLKVALQEPAFYYYSPRMGSFDYSAIRPVPSFMDQVVAASGDESNVFRMNDGVVPVFSQWHPLPCKLTSCQHFQYPDDASEGDHDKIPSSPEPGTWFVFEMEDAHHCTVAPTWLDTPRQKAFWRDLGQWLQGVDMARS